MTTGTEETPEERSAVFLIPMSSKVRQEGATCLVQRSKVTVKCQEWLTTIIPKLRTSPRSKGIVGMKTGGGGGGMMEAKKESALEEFLHHGWVTYALRGVMKLRWVEHGGEEQRVIRI